MAKTKYQPMVIENNHGSGNVLISNDFDENLFYFRP
jgi:hypothetical protein